VLELGGEWWIESPDVDPRYAGLLEEALRALDPADSDLRAQVLSRLAIALYFVPAAAGRRVAQSEEAEAMARRVGDRVTLALALGGRHWALWDPARLPERIAVADELVRLAQDIGSRELELRSHVWRLGDLLELGQIERVDAEIDTIARLAAELRQPMYQWWTPMFRAMRALLEGRASDAERLAEEGMALGQRVHGRVVVPIFGSYLVWLRRAQGRLGELEAVVRGMLDHRPTEPAWRAVLAFVHVDVGRLGEARREFDQLADGDFASVPRDLRWLPTMAMLAQIAAALDDRRRAAVLYDLLRPHDGRVIATAAGAGPCLGAASRYLGLLATTLGRWDEAERHLRDALALHARMRARPLVAFAQHEYGALLLLRDGPEDRERGRALVEAALATARELGMSSLREKIESGRARPRRHRRPLAPVPPPPRPRGRRRDPRPRRPTCSARTASTGRSSTRTASRG
jgi:hypothetical protein